MLDVERREAYFWKDYDVQAGRVFVVFVVVFDLLQTSMGLK